MAQFKPLKFKEIDPKSYKAITPFCNYEVYLRGREWHAVSGTFKGSVKVCGIRRKSGAKTSAEAMEACNQHYMSILNKCIER